MTLFLRHKQNNLYQGQSNANKIKIKHQMPCIFEKKKKLQSNSRFMGVINMLSSTVADV